MGITESRFTPEPPINFSNNHPSRDEIYELYKKRQYVIVAQQAANDAAKAAAAAQQTAQQVPNQQTKALANEATQHAVAAQQSVEVAKTKSNGLNGAKEANNHAVAALSAAQGAQVAAVDVAGKQSLPSVGNGPMSNPASKQVDKETFQILKMAKTDKNMVQPPARNRTESYSDAAYSASVSRMGKLTKPKIYSKQSRVGVSMFGDRTKDDDSRADSTVRVQKRQGVAKKLTNDEQIAHNKIQFAFADRTTGQA